MRLKKLGIILSALFFTIVSVVPKVTYAMDYEKRLLLDGKGRVLTPFWSKISDISVYMSVDGMTLYPEVYIEAKSSSGAINGTVYLEKYVSGEWKTEKSWDLKGTSNAFLSKSYKGTSGIKYRTRVVVTVDGEKAEATSKAYTI